jgi:hypothetical protein
MPNTKRYISQYKNQRPMIIQNISRPYQAKRICSALSAAVVLGFVGGCASTAPPQVPSGAAMVPINKAIPAAQVAAQAKAAETRSLKPQALSASEIAVFRNLDPERFEVLSHSASQ